MDLRSTFLSSIFDAFLGDTPLDHIFSHMPIMGIFGNGKMVRNIQEIKNPGGSNHFEQLAGKCLTLIMMIIMTIMIMMPSL